MTYTSEWTEGEFILLLSRPDLADDGFADIIPERDKEAIGGVRAAVHNFHAGGDTSMLSEMMMSLLGSKDTLVTCPVCKVSF
ncbi:MAG TPA: hypothetical protein DCR71_02650 [Dehalococcoidia bacterium]|jgi:hypothetical protein|nr:hypothetical protein [Dehalococcoidia bacterium]